jgi:pimeloyl-ACP methyl ester carboxylesterase
MKKITFFLATIWENLKSFLIAVLIFVAIIIAVSSIIHNVLKIKEIYSEDKMGYKNLTNVNDNRMNINVVGTGDQTIVILPAFGESSPIEMYKTYADRLSENYRVVTIEYFGYGYSLSSKDERTNAKFAQEINSALVDAKISGPYIIIANGTSSMYAYTYANMYADSVQKLVVIDGVYPSSIKDTYTKKYVKDLTTNISMTSYAELTGYARILSYISPSTFKIDKMKKLGYSKEDIKFYRKMIANRFYSGTMRREIKALASNMEELEDYQYPEYLQVTQILSTGYINEVKELVEENKAKTILSTYANNLITNSLIQNIVTIQGEKDCLSLDNPDSVVEAITGNANEINPN